MSLDFPAIGTTHCRGRCWYLSRLLLLMAPFLVGMPAAHAGGDAPMPPGRVALLEPAIDDAAAWQKLPRAEKGTGQALPLWARALVPSLPYTTAAMLELDYRHRTQGALPPKLRAMLRWTYAHALHSSYAEANASADFRRCGGTSDELHALQKAGTGLPEPDRAALTFARKLAVKPNAVTDQDVAELVRCYGEKQVVAMVLLLAYASFQDRLALALDLPLEPDGPLAPLDVRFAPVPLGTRLTVPRPEPIALPKPPASAEPQPGRQRPDVDALRKRIEKQRSRRPRISLPDGEGKTVHFGAVCRGYQPELASAWAVCQHHFGAEANQDPVFETSVFWIVSYAQQSFY